MHRFLINAARSLLAIPLPTAHHAIMLQEILRIALAEIDRANREALAAEMREEELEAELRRLREILALIGEGGYSAPVQVRRAKRALMRTRPAQV